MVLCVREREEGGRSADETKTPVYQLCKCVRSVVRCRFVVQNAGVPNRSIRDRQLRCACVGEGAYVVNIEHAIFMQKVPCLIPDNST